MLLSKEFKGLSQCSARAEEFRDGIVCFDNEVIAVVKKTYGKDYRFQIVHCLAGELFKLVLSKDSTEIVKLYSAFEMKPVKKRKNESWASCLVSKLGL